MAFCLFSAAAPASISHAPYQVILLLFSAAEMFLAGPIPSPSQSVFKHGTWAAKMHNVERLTSWDYSVFVLSFWHLTSDMYRSTGQDVAQEMEIN